MGLCQGTLHMEPDDSGLLHSSINAVGIGLTQKKPPSLSIIRGAVRCMNPLHEVRNAVKSNDPLQDSLIE